MEAFCNMLLSVFPDLDHINDQLEEIKYAKQETLRVIQPSPKKFVRQMRL